MFGKGAIATLAIAAAYFVLPAEADKVQIFAQPAPTSIARIKAEHRVVNGTGLGSLTIGSAGTDGQKLLISVEKAGDPRIVKCRVAVGAVSPVESRADVDCTQPGSEDDPVRRVGTQAMAMIVREHVAAAIENRPYDTDKVADRMIALVAMNGPILAASIQSQPE